MTGEELGTRLADAAARAEADAPRVDPLQALAGRRRRRQDRRGHGAALAFVLFVLLLQLVPTEALGAESPVVTAAPAASRG